MDTAFRNHPEIRFGGFSDVDGTMAFYTRVNALLTPETTVVDVGCGRGQAAEDPIPFRRGLQILRGKCQRVIGIDPDPIGEQNPCVDEFRRMAGGRWPVGDGEAGLCLCDNVLEHVPDPDEFFSECRRALGSGGYLCVRTPNRMSYFGLASRLIPNRLHARILLRLQPDRKSRDVFPTLYRCNTVGAIRRMLRKHGFDGCVYGYEAEPSYLGSSGFLYALGALHQRLAPRAFRLALFAFAAKSARPGEEGKPR